MSTSKVIDNLDTAARAAGFAMVGSEDSLNQSPAASPVRADKKAEQPDASRHSWLSQAASLKATWSFGAGWSPWKATA